MFDYLDTDVAYLIGLIIGRGKMSEREDSFRLVLPFHFEKPELEGYDQFSSFLASVAGQTLERLQKLLGPYVFTNVEEEKTINLVINLPKDHLIVRNLRFILTNQNSEIWPLHYVNYRIPEIIKKADYHIKQEFIIGFADISGNIRRSNRDQAGRHRVYLDVLNENWHLPVEICNFLQDELKIPVSNIAWGHPNLRDPKAKSKIGIFREHQIRIYAEDFLKIGFYISHKQEVLKKLADENRINYPNRTSKFCNGYQKRKSSKKAKHPLEKAENLPKEIQGKHFNYYWELCKAFNCQKAKTHLLKR